MSRFYGTLQGNRGEATRCGSEASGIRATAASWSGAVRSYVFDKDGEDWARVELIRWRGVGTSALLYEGPVNPIPARLRPARLEELEEVTR